MKRLILAATFLTAFGSAEAGTISSGGELGAKGKAFSCDGGSRADNWQVGAETVSDFPAMHDLKFWRSVDVNGSPAKGITYLSQVLPITSHISYGESGFQMSYKGTGIMHVNDPSTGESIKKESPLELVVNLSPAGSSSEHQGKVTFKDPRTDRMETFDVICEVIGEGIKD